MEDGEQNATKSSYTIQYHYQLWTVKSIELQTFHLKIIFISFLMYFQYDEYVFKSQIEIVPAVNLLKKECQAIFLLNYKIDFKSLWKQEWLDNGRPHYHSFATASIFTTIAILKRRDARAHSIFGLREV